MPGLLDALFGRRRRRRRRSVCWEIIGSDSDVDYLGFLKSTLVILKIAFEDKHALRKIAVKAKIFE